MPTELERTLHQHCQALRGLARALVGDADADDLLQDTAVQALGASGASARTPRAWLAAIARHLAHKRRRTERRRAERERAAARPEAMPPADREIENGDTLRRLVDHVLALPQPYREAVLLRWLRELPPAEIARRTGAPLATVKSRLQRGLGMLRERLGEERDADRNDWRAALCGAFGIERALPPAGAAATATTGALLMGSGVKLAFAGTAAVLAAAVLFFPTYGDVAPRQAIAGDPGASAAIASSVVPRPVDAPPGEQGTTDGPLAVTAVRTAPEPVPTLRGRCIDESGAPVAGIQALLTATAKRELPSGAFEDSVREEHEVVTGIDGVFVLQLDTAENVRGQLELKRSGIATMRASFAKLAQDEPIDLGDVEVRPGVRVRGRLLDTAGAPVARWQIALQRARDGASSPAPVAYLATRTDETGSFTFPIEFVPGTWEVEVSRREIVEGERLELVGAAVDVRVVVRASDPSRRIEGVVVDDSGAPIAHARVSADEPMLELDEGTDERGVFVIHRLDRHPERIPLRASQSGFQSSRPMEVAWGTLDHRITLSRLDASGIHVVRAEGGEPVEDFALWVACEAHTERGRPGGLKSRGSHEQGLARLSLAAGSYQLIVVPDDPTLAISDPMRVEVEAGSPIAAVVRILRSVERTVRVLHQDGTPVHGAVVELCRAPDDDEAAQLPPQPLARWCQTSPRARVPLLLQTETTDAKGEVRLRGACGTSFRLQLPGPGHEPATIEGVRLDDAEPLVITVAAGAILRGRCKPAEALADLRRVAGSDVRAGTERDPVLHLSQPDRVLPRSHDPGFPIAADGSFEIRHVPPGVWDVRVLVGIGIGTDFVATAVTVVEDVPLAAEQPTELVVDLTPFRTGGLEALVLHNGEPLAGEVVLPMSTVRPGGQLPMNWSARTDDEGRFRCERFHGTYRLTWRADPRAASRAPLRAVETITLVPGSTVVQTFHFRTGTLRLRVVDAAGAAVAGTTILLRDASGELRHRLPATGTDGTTELLVEAETFTCLVGDTVLDTIAVREATTTEIRLRLPPQ